ncbi:hypothetical protein [Blastococcus sp. TF02A-30]|uniref:hypothetical protein n=1 Tax=Blastococcus sp. TF02A-30 TaxID=2250580 RepID=UPI000DE833FD|nr:hypothetical protein [Blastococcus sp. TF02A-30]RBY91015.1 hypothetical protein DQ241_04845 [Blastococcus sp. TF02A-30]
MSTGPDPARRRTRPVLGVVAVAVLCALAFVVLDVVIAAFVVVLLLTGLVIALAARDWDQHPDFEQRELERARRRKEKWQRNAGARARDRARWEAHQARRSAAGGAADDSRSQPPA